MKWIDKDTWKREAHYQFFRQMEYPHFSVTMNLDITRFLNRVKEQKLPFYYAMIYAVTRAANEVEEFRTRIYQGDPVIWEETHPAFTALKNDDDQFYVVIGQSRPDMEQFVTEAGEKLKAQTVYFPEEELKARGDLFYVTCLPWLSYTGLSHTVSLEQDDASPRIAWGKYYQAGEKIYLPYSVQVHHSLVDGVHVSRHVEALQTFLNL